VIEPTTVGPQARTASSASFVVQCSRTIRSLGRQGSGQGELAGNTEEEVALPWEVGMELAQRGQKLGLRIEHGDNVSVTSSGNVTGGGAWNLSMQVEHHVMLLHSFEYGVIALVIEHTRLRVRGHTRGVDLHACNSGACGLGDGGGGDRLVQIERHEEFYIRGQCLKTVTVGNGSSHCGNWRD